MTSFQIGQAFFGIRAVSLKGTVFSFIRLPAFWQAPGTQPWFAVGGVRASCHFESASQL